jgi:hypothetical protein
MFCSLITGRCRACLTFRYYNKYHVSDLFQKQLVTTYTATSLIKEQNNGEMALDVYKYMRQQGVVPNHYCINALLVKLTNNSKEMLNLVPDVCNYNIKDAFTLRTLLKASIQQNATEYVDRLFHRMVSLRIV